MVSVIRASIRLFLFVSLCFQLYFSYLLASLVFAFLARLGWKLPTEMIMARIMRMHFRVMLASAGIRIRYELQNCEDLPSSHGLFLSNHVNYIDILALARLHPMGFVAKREVGEWPLMGDLIRRMNTLFVKRECTESRVRCLRQLQKGVEHLCYCVFPQGTTTDSYELDSDPWYPGQMFCVRQPGVRVFAVGMRYYNHKKMAWINNMTLGPHLWWVLKQRRNYLAVVVKEIGVNLPSGQSLRPLSEHIRQEINQLSKRAAILLPISDRVEDEEAAFCLESTSS